MVSMHTENVTRYNRVVFVTKITRLQMKIVILTVIEDDVVLLEVGEFSDDDESDSENRDITASQLQNWKAMYNMYDPTFLWRL